MQNVLLAIHLLIALALIGSILLQRSEGGALGIGGGGGGGFMSGRGTANALTRLTAMLATGFFITCIALTLLARYDRQSIAIPDSLGKPAAVSAPATTAPATGQPASPASGNAPAAPAAGSTASAPAGGAASAPSNLDDLQPILPAGPAPAK